MYFGCRHTQKSPQGIVCRWILTAARSNCVPGHAADMFCSVSSSVTTSTVLTTIKTSLIKTFCLRLRLSTFESPAGMISLSARSDRVGRTTYLVMNKYFIRIRDLFVQAS